MTKKTRYFMTGSAAVLAGGLARGWLPTTAVDFRPWWHRPVRPSLLTSQLMRRSWLTLT